jgi:hypothetical protein
MSTLVGGNAAVIAVASDTQNDSTVPSVTKRFQTGEGLNTSISSTVSSEGELWCGTTPSNADPSNEIERFPSSSLLFVEDLPSSSLLFVEDLGVFGDTGGLMLNMSAASALGQGCPFDTNPSRLRIPAR